jgi:3-methyladenine DNA glycosylase/8-oxoguanine DNA glycosylase
MGVALPRTDSVDVRATLSVHRAGAGDPTTLHEPGGWWRATITPHGPATVHVWWGSAGVDAEAWGPGGDWLLARVPRLVGWLDAPARFEDAHPVVMAAQRNHPGLRIGGGSGLFHALLPTVIGQRVTTGEARRSWRQICNALGERAPGPRRLSLPPSPRDLSRQPYWWFHRFGVERSRADTLRTLGRHAATIDELDAGDDPVEARRRLGLLPGVGVWTIGSVLGPVFGDPDAIAVGDFWLKHIVTWALAGEPRGDDERMIELLSPYTGQRGRVVRLLSADGWRPLRFGPGQRIIPIAAL